MPAKSVRQAGDGQGTGRQRWAGRDGQARDLQLSKEGSYACGQESGQIGR